MSFKYTKPIRIIAYILTVLFFIGAIWFGWNNRQVKINHLQAEVDILWNYKLNEPSLREQIKSLEAKNIKIKNELEQINIHYAADEKYIDYINSQYLKAITYINISETILQAQGIEYLYLGDRQLEQ